MKLQVPNEIARKFPPILVLRLLARVGFYSIQLEG